MLVFLPSLGKKKVMFFTLCSYRKIFKVLAVFSLGEDMQMEK